MDPRGSGVKEYYESDFLDAISDPVTYETVADRVGCAEPTARYYCNRLIRDGELEIHREKPRSKPRLIGKK